MRDRTFLYGVLCGAVLTLAGAAIAQKNPDNETDTAKPLIVAPASVPRYSGQQGREACGECLRLTGFAHILFTSS